MTTFVVLLRAINLGNVRRVPMADLRTVLTEAGYGDVTTHLQTGNVVLDHRARKPVEVERAVEKALRRVFDFEIEVMARSATQMKKVAASHPLLGARVSPATLNVGFLKRRPTAAAADAVADADFGRDRFMLRGSELYLQYPNGLGRSKMSPAFFERRLATPLTVRSWKVVTKLVELSSG